MRPIKFAVASLIAMCAVSQYVYSASLTIPINAADYDIYIGDIDGNGFQDFYFKAKPLFVLLHGNLSTPLFIPRPDSMVLRNGNVYAAPVASTLTSAQVTAKIQGNIFQLAQLSSDYLILSGTSVLVQGAGLPTVTIFTYDELGRVTKATDTVTGDRGYKYDPAGNRTKVTVGAP